MKSAEGNFLKGRWQVDSGQKRQIDVLVSCGMARRKVRKIKGDYVDLRTKTWKMLDVIGTSGGGVITQQPGRAQFGRFWSVSPNKTSPETQTSCQLLSCSTIISFPRTTRENY